MQEKNSNPRVVKAEFVKSAQSIKDSVQESRSEVVFMGRSNVGKSSTINLLTNRKNLAKSSSTPGKTQLINFFDVEYLYNDKRYPLYFVDLPGFGYAKVSKNTKEIWQKNLLEYIQNRVAIRLFIHLRDARHPNTAIDNRVEEFLKNSIRPDQKLLTIFTKIDKLNQKERNKLKKEYPNSIFLSNLKKSGADKVHQEILNYVFGEEFDNAKKS
jgi:GTP-binding protein